MRPARLRRWLYAVAGVVALALLSCGPRASSPPPSYTSAALHQLAPNRRLVHEAPFDDDDDGGGATASEAECARAVVRPLACWRRWRRWPAWDNRDNASSYTLAYGERSIGPTGAEVRAAVDALASGRRRPVRPFVRDGRTLPTLEQVAAAALGWHRLPPCAVPARSGARVALVGAKHSWGSFVLGISTVRTLVNAPERLYESPYTFDAFDWKTRPPAGAAPYDVCVHVKSRDRHGGAALAANASADFVGWSDAEAGCKLIVYRTVDENEFGVANLSERARRVREALVDARGVRVYWDNSRTEADSLARLLGERVAVTAYPEPSSNFASLMNDRLRRGAPPASIGAPGNGMDDAVQRMVARVARAHGLRYVNMSALGEHAAAVAVDSCFAREGRARVSLATADAHDQLRFHCGTATVQLDMAVFWPAESAAARYVTKPSIKASNGASHGTVVIHRRGLRAYDDFDAWGLGLSADSEDELSALVGALVQAPSGAGRVPPPRASHYLARIAEIVGPWLHYGYIRMLENVVCLQQAGYFEHTN